MSQACHDQLREKYANDSLGVVFIDLILSYMMVTT